MPIDNSAPALRVAGVPEHFNLPWRERAAAKHGRGAIDYREFRGGTGAMVKALANDEVDVAILLTEGALLNISRGGQHRIVKIYVDTPLEWGIHVAAASEITDVAQIRGKRYAISRRGSGSHIMAAVHAADRGWPVDALAMVKVRNLEGARRALPAATADVFLWEKTMTQPYVEAGEFRCIGTFQSPWPSFVVCASDRVISDRAADLRQLLEQINTRAGHLQADCDSALAIAKTYGLRLAAAERWLNRTHWNLDFTVSAQLLAPVLAVLKKLELGVDAAAQIENMLHPL